MALETSAASGLEQLVDGDTPEVRIHQANAALMPFHHLSISMQESETSTACAGMSILDGRSYYWRRSEDPT